METYQLTHVERIERTKFVEALDALPLTQHIEINDDVRAVVFHEHLLRTKLENCEVSRERSGERE